MRIGRSSRILAGLLEALKKGSGVCGKDLKCRSFFSKLKAQEVDPSSYGQPASQSPLQRTVFGRIFWPTQNPSWSLVLQESGPQNGLFGPHARWTSVTLYDYWSIQKVFLINFDSSIIVVIVVIVVVVVTITITIAITIANPIITSSHPHILTSSLSSSSSSAVASSPSSCSSSSSSSCSS